jgi:Fe2+ or Zn2+ uptake regulation protein
MAELVDQVLAKMRAAGKRITPERRLLIEIVTANPHLDADRIHRLAKRARPEIGLATVYRTLKVLEECELVRTDGLGEGHAHYEIHGDDHVHLVCSECGKILDVPVPAALLKRIESRGFRLQRTHFECFGVCAECAKRRVSKRER